MVIAAPRTALPVGNPTWAPDVDTEETTGVDAVGPRAIDSLPACFERLIEMQPSAPAVILRRPGRRDRVWNRAAVEHRAVRIGMLCADLGLAADAAVAIAGHGALDVMGAAYFILATGRILTDAPDAALVLDDALLARADVLREPYRLRCVVHGSDAAAHLGGDRFTQAQLLRAARRSAPEDAGLLWRGLYALATGKPFVVDAGDRPDARLAVCAA